MSRFISKIWGVRASNRWGSTTGNRYDEMQERIYLRDMVGPLGFTSRAGISTTAQSVGADDRIYAPYNVYKGKAALSAHPIPPTFTKLDSGALRVGRQGIIMLSFSPALGERKYDWERKQKFALSATEVGSLINLASNGSCEFFHDPSMQTSNAGQVRKNLAVKPHADGSGYFISLNVVNSIQKTNERFTVSVTSAEFAVMRTAFSFALPHIMGWDRLFPPATDTHMSKYKRGGENSTKLDRHLEWGR